MKVGKLNSGTEEDKIMNKHQKIERVFKEKEIALLKLEYKRDAVYKKKQDEYYLKYQKKNNYSSKSKKEQDDLDYNFYKFYWPEKRRLLEPRMKPLYEEYKKRIEKIYNDRLAYLGISSDEEEGGYYD